MADEIIEILAPDDIVPNGGSSVVIVDNLDSVLTDAALSANQGRVLKDMIEAIPTGITHVETAPSATTTIDGDGLVPTPLKVNVIAVPNSIVSTDATHRFVTDAQITSWDGKQPALGFTPENTANKNQANGYVGLDGSNKINPAQLPATTVDWVDIANKPATFAPIIGSAANQAVAGNDARLTNARTPTAHTHPIDQVVGLQTVLDTKASIASLAPVATSGLYSDLTGKPEIALPVPFTGDIYNKVTWADLTDFAVNTAGATVAGGKIIIPDAGVVDFTKQLQLSSVSCLNHWFFSIDFALTVPIAAGTTGISIGLQSINSDSLNSWANYFRMSSSDNTGRMQFFAQSNSGTWTTISNAASNLTFVQNDVVRLSMERSNEKVFLRVENLTNPVAPVEYATTAPFNTNPIAPNTGRFTIFAQGGACTISGIKVINKELKNANVLFLGDSKTFGYGSSMLQNTYTGMMGKRFANIAISGGFGDKTSDVLLHIAEIIAIAPKQVVLSIGSNDKRFGVYNATFEANYTSITSQLTAAGIQVIHLSPSYETAQDLTEQYNFVKTNFTPFIDIFYAIQQSGNLYSDGIHWSDAGNKWVAKQIINSNLINGLKTDQEY